MIKNEHLLYLLLLTCWGTLWPLPAQTSITPPPLAIPICQPITSSRDLNTIFPTSSSQVNRWNQLIKNHIEQGVGQIVRIAHAKRTFANTIRPLDTMVGQLDDLTACYSLIVEECTDQGLKKSIQSGLRLLATLSAELNNNNKLYHACKEYQRIMQHESLSQTERLFVEQTIKNYEQRGANGQVNKQKLLFTLEQKIQATPPKLEQPLLEKSFLVSAEELNGVPLSILSTLPVKHNRYMITLNPTSFSDEFTYRSIISTCHTQAVRKQLYLAMRQHKPSNLEPYLIKLIADKNNYAQQMGYPNFAAYDLAKTMAKTPQQALSFLKNALDKTLHKATSEMQQLRKTLPGSIQLDHQGNILPWDYEYVRLYHRSRTLPTIASNTTEYFAVDKVIMAMTNLFGLLFGLQCKEITTSWKWHPSVRLLEVLDVASKHCLGYIYLDLFKRSHKQDRTCCVTLSNAIRNQEHSQQAVNVVFCNFAHDKEGLTHNEVVSLLHEFGHALHTTMARPLLKSHAIFYGQPDFFEMPSQLFEQWAKDRDTLPLFSSHYQTGHQLSPAQVDARLAMYEFEKWKSNLSSIVRSIFAISVFLEPHVPPFQLWERIQQTYIPYEALRLNLFWWYHTTLNSINDAMYGPKFFGYLWANHYAEQLFSQIKHHGILNHDYGRKLRNELFAHGSEQDPQLLLSRILNG